MARLLGSQGTIGAAFALSRLFSMVALIGITGLTSHFISTIVQAQLTPPALLVAIISIVCIAAVYSMITFFLFLDNLLPHLITVVGDAILLVMLLVVSIIAGRPLSHINCFSVGVLNSEATGDGALSFAYALGETISEHEGVVQFSGFAAAGRAACFESKSVWGLCSALW